MTQHTSTPRLSRRAFVVSSATAGAGLSLGFHWPAAAQTKPGEVPEVNAWVVVQPDESCIIRVAIY
jgi:isoquinoline 1-oxidoreductase beta subunit